MLQLKLAYLFALLWCAYSQKLTEAENLRNHRECGHTKSSGDPDNVFKLGCRRGSSRCDEAAIGDFPHAGLLNVEFSQGGKTYSRFCGGSLISRRHFLTAAHCFLKDVSTKKDEKLTEACWRFEYFDSISKHSRINIGSLDADLPYDSPHAFPIKKVRTHGGWLGRGCAKFEGNDVAIVELGREVPEAWVAERRAVPVCLPNAWAVFAARHSSSPPLLHIAGWGYEPNEKKGRASKLLHATMKMKKTLRGRADELPEALRVHQRDERGYHQCARHVCTDQDTNNACKGDSGSGVVHRSRSGRTSVWGIVSVTNGCDSRDTYHAEGRSMETMRRESSMGEGAAHTDVGAHVAWICHATGVCPLGA